MALIADTAMERRCRDLVGSLDLPRPCSTDDLVRAVAGHEDRPIVVRPLPPDAGPGVSGLVLGTATGYVVSYPERADEWWQLICLGHELAHILCGHLRGPDRAITATGTADATDPMGDADPLARHLPDLQAALRAWGRLYRCELRGEVEREAELTATLLVQRIQGEREPDRRERSQPRAGAPGAPDAASLGRFEELLGGRGPRPW